MRELRLEPGQPRPKRFSLTKAAAGQVPDLVGRSFTADAPGEKLVGDITYISTGEGWLYHVSAEFGKALTWLGLRRSAGKVADRRVK